MDLDANLREQITIYKKLAAVSDYTHDLANELLELETELINSINEGMFLTKRNVDKLKNEIDLL